MASPTRLPPAPSALGSRQSTPAKTAPEMSMLAPLSPGASLSKPPAPRKPSSMDMPLASPVLVASRSPPTSPHGSARRVDDDERAAAAKMFETYALRIYEATRKKPAPARDASTVGVGAGGGVLVSVPTKQRRVVAVPTLASNNNNNTNHSHAKAKAGGGHKNKKRQKEEEDDDTRHVNAGVYALENRKTGHRFVGTTWDLRNAAAQSFADLRDGAHPHRALATCFQLYGAEASGIVFRVLERVALKAPSKDVAKEKAARPGRKRRPQGDDPAFDVRAMEALLHKRQLFHQRKLVRECALALVQRRLVRPVLAQYFPVWRRHTLELARDLEAIAAAASVQSVVRAFLARRRLERRRRQRAAVLIAKFFALCAMKRVLCKRRERRRRHDSATRIQQCVQRFLQHKRRIKRGLAIKKWLNARTIQRVYRGHRGRLVAQVVRRTCTRERSAVRLQALARRFLVRCRVHEQRRVMWFNAQAARIQACWRGFATRQFVSLPLRSATQFTKQQESAAQRLQDFYRRYVVRHKLSKAAQQHAFELHHVTRIHVAYKNYLAKKFGWAAMTYMLEQTSAVRIQRAMRRWFFFACIARLVLTDRRDKAARRLQRVYRGSRGRRVARGRRWSVRRHRAASRLQRLWRLSHAFTKLHAAVDYWRVDKNARLIQARYRGFHRRRVYLVFRAEARRQRAATRIQSTFRSHITRREWRRRLQLQRDGIACQDCGNNAAIFFSWRFSMELCGDCIQRWHERSDIHEDKDVVELALYRRQQRLATHVQRVYRGFQVRKVQRFGLCAFCEIQAVRVACQSCPGTRRFCHSCDALFHKITPATKPHPSRLRIEEFIRQENAAILLQKQARRYAHRHTIASLHHRRQTIAATKIQNVYVSRRQRRHTRALVAARYDLAYRQEQAATRIQRRVRVFIARCELNRLQARKQNVVVIQRVFRGYRGRNVAENLRLRRDAAVCIQRHVRGARGRYQAELRRAKVERQKQQEAALVLQRHSREWLVRRRMWHKRRECAAVVIQSAWRRNRARRVLFKLFHDRDERLRLEMEERERERQARQREKERIAATQIQCAWRRHEARAQLATLRVSNARRRRMEQLTIWLAVERKSATRIQRFVRCKWLTRATSASLVMQCSVRQWLSRRDLKRRRVARRAAICIQRAFRYSRVKRKLTRLASLESVAVAGTVGGWVELFDEDSGCVYYYNRETMASQWVKPPELMGEAPGVAYYQQQQQQLGELELNEPPEWVEYWDDNVGASYFYNTKTGEATWATPEGVTSSGNQSGEWIDHGAWPPGAPVDGKLKYYGDPKLATQSSNQTEEEAVDPATAQAYYVDENGNTYAYDYPAYDYSAYMDENGYSGYPGYGADALPAAYTAATSASTTSAQPHEGFDESLVDTSYDINYEIYMTQLQRDAEQQQQQDDDP